MTSQTRRPNPKDERREKVAQLKAEQQRAEKRRNRIVIGVAALVGLALVVPAAFIIVGEQRRQSEIAAAASEPIDGVQLFDDLGANHVTTPVDYQPTPPVGGDHHPTWQNCGFYTEPVVDEHAVHSLEHGAVWLTYAPDLPEADVATLRALTQRHPYLLVSPYDGVTGPLVASAWGVQLELDGVDDERLEPFLRAYLQGPQTPEPGAACTGGVGGA
ncbi:DUF3105 domain-containing protein [Actinotalea sp. K2]|uniref:DUF3105 domain-containing protein n=1 Tax=Actinotalea sp. K2 TaxID=2939438 RepID=UPI002017EA57|nr:DUF3105 domain-containing protein [Actinotalea sp. K2]MCL3862400.1 DUF3105 domain-containing protein [Actinotalea sp. K2]